MEETTLELCFGCGKDNEAGLRLRRNLVFEDDRLRIETKIEPHFSGFPGVVHGGIVATLIDEAMGIYCSERFGRGAVTAQLNVRFLAPAPAGRSLVVTAGGRRDGRKVISTADVSDADGKLLASGEGILLFPRAEGADELQG